MTSDTKTMRKKETTSPAQPMTGEFHYHGDPVLEAILKHDTADDQAARRKALKELYEQHAKLVQKERAGTFLGDHTLWCLQDYLPEHVGNEHAPTHYHYPPNDGTKVSSTLSSNPK